MLKKVFFLIAVFVISQISFSQSIAAGSEYSLYLCSDGTVKAWGKNNKGQLGLGKLSNSIKLPTTIPNLTNVVAISAGFDHSLFLKSDGTVWACGSNMYGALGDGTLTDRVSPVQISGLSGIKKISAGLGYSLFLKIDGSVWACGLNKDGELGFGNTINIPIPIKNNSLANISNVVAGTKKSQFIKADGSVLVCGLNTPMNIFTLQSPVQFNYTSPQTIIGLDSVVDARNGVGGCLFLKSNGDIWYSGQIMVDTTTVSKLQKIKGIGNVTAIAFAGHTCLFKKGDGTVWAFGDNFDGQLSLPGNSIKTPILIPGLSNISEISLAPQTYINRSISNYDLKIALAPQHALYLKNDGTLSVCGTNDFGQLGTGTSSDVFVAKNVGNPCIPPITPQVNFSNFPTSLCVGSNINIEPEISGSLPDVNFTIDNSINVTAPKNIAKNSHAVFVLDGTDKIMRYDLNGNLQYTYNSNAIFTGLTAFAPDENDNVWIYNTVNQRLTRLGSGGVNDTSSVGAFPLWNGLKVTDMTFADVPMLEKLIVADTSGNGDLLTSYDVTNSDPWTNNQLSLNDSSHNILGHNKITSIAFDNNFYAERRMLSADPQHDMLWQRRFTGGNWFNSARPLVDTNSTKGLKLDFIDTDTTAKLDSYSTSIITTSSSSKNVIGIVWTNTNPNGESFSYLDTNLLSPIVTQAPIGIISASNGNMPQFWIADKGLNKLLRVQMVTYRLTPSLPPGLKFSTISGQVEGTPTSVVPPQTYQLIVNNGLGSDTTYFTFGVTPTLPPTNTPGTSSTNGKHNDGLTIKYYDPNNCSKLIEIADAVGGTSPGQTQISQTVYPLVSVIANDSLIRRVNQIRAENQDTLTVNVKLYYTYQDIQAFNTSRGSTLLSNDTVGGAMQMAVLQMHDRPDGSKQPIIHSPITANWSTANHYWIATVPVTKFSEFYGSDMNTLNTFDCTNTGTQTLSIGANYYVWNNDTLFASGIYKDTLINKTGCDSITTLNLTLFTTGVSALSSNSSIGLFPNPTKDLLTLVVKGDAIKPNKIKITNVVGATVYLKDVNGSAIIDMSNLETGIYFVIVETNEKPLLYRIIKE